MKEKSIEQLKRDLLGSIQGLLIFLAIALIFFRDFMWIYIPIIAISYGFIETAIVLNLRYRNTSWPEIKLVKDVAGSWFAVGFVGFILHILFDFSWLFWVPIAFILLGAITTTAEYPNKVAKLRSEAINASPIAIQVGSQIITQSGPNSQSILIAAPTPIYTEATQTILNDEEKSIKFCPHCGSSLKPGVKFCSLCGQKL